MLHIRFKRHPAPDGGRVFRSGLLSAATVAAAVVLAVLINLLVGAIPARYTQFDLSAGGLYTLGDTSRQVAGSLEEDLTIYYLCETGAEDRIITRLLDQYAAAGPHIRWEQIDPAVYPTFASRYGAENAASGSLILDTGDASTVLDAAGLYVYDYASYYETGAYDVRFDGEGQITSAIYRLTSGQASRAYYTTNHSEAALSDTLTQALEAQNIETAPLSLLSGGIPEDCALLIVNCPASDFAGADGVVDETALLQEYLAGGGKLLLMTDAYYDTPNLDGVMAGFGLARVDGLVVEGDPDHSLYGYSYYLLPDYAQPSVSTALDGITSSVPVLVQMAQGIRITPADGVTAEPLLTTSGSAYSKAAGYEMTTTEREEGDLEGPFDLAVYAQAEDTGAEVIWIGSSNMDNEANYLSVPGNCDFLVGCAASLTGQSSDILIDSKALEADLLTIPAGVVAPLGLTFLLVIPAGLLIAGAVVTIRRRRR